MILNSNFVKSQDMTPYAIAHCQPQTTKPDPVRIASGLNGASR
jgi:hypothetical protein